MSLQIFFDNLALLADAPNGVAKLRELILQLAVEGKLVSQQSNEEAAAGLLKRIQSEKQQLARNGKLRKVISPETIEKKEIPFRLPASWQWARLSHLCELENGDRGKNYPSRRQLVSDGIPFINAGHLQSGEICMGSMNYIAEHRYNLLKSGKIRDGDILFCLRGSLGKSALVKNISRGAIASSLVIIRLIGDLNRQFVLNYLFSPLAAQMIDRFDNGTAQPNLSSADLGKFLFPVPPLKEQHRIVAKVDELMRLCDELEAKQHAKRESRVRLNNAALAPLNKAASLASEEFQQATARLGQRFDTLYESVETVGKLRSTILQLAMQGKLVGQDFSEEPAHVFIEKIKKQKSSFGKRAIKRNDALAIRPDEMAYPIPASWRWVRLEDICEVGTGSTPLSSNADYYNDGTIAWVTSAATSEEYIRDVAIHITQKAVSDYRLKVYPAETLIVALYGQGKTRGQISQLKIDATVNQACAAICLVETSEEHSWFVRRFFEKSYEELRALAAGGAQPNLNIRKIKETLIPLPPFAEQKRIVTKVNQLMSLCDDLEAKLRQAEAHSEKLMNVAVQHVLDTVSSKNESQREPALALSSTET